MKNVISLFTMLLIGGSLLAQTPSADESTNSAIPGDGISPFSLEISVGQTLGGGQSLVTAPGVKFRYFFNQNMALRVGIDYSSFKTVDNFSENFDGSGAIGTATMKSSYFDFKAGFEYHFASTKRLSPYVALDIIFGSGSMKEDGENSDGYDYYANFNYTEETKMSSFGTNLIAGLDFYVAQNLFVGAEFGFGMKWNTEKEGTWSWSDGNNSGSGTTPEAKSSATAVGAFGGLRLGWRF